MRRHVTAVLWLLMTLLPAGAATLERLTMEEMIDLSSAVMRGRVSSSWSQAKGGNLSTVYRIQVTERFKSAAAATIDIILPGGSLNGTRQSFPGVPQLTQGKEYMIFVWTDANGGNHLLGLTQGLFEVPLDDSGEMLAVRNATSETMLDAKTGRVVQDAPVRMKLRDLGMKIRAQAPVRSAK